MDYAFYTEFSYYDQLKERHLGTFTGTKIIYLFILHFVHIHLLEANFSFCPLSSKIYNSVRWVVDFLIWGCKIGYSNLPNNRVGPINRVGGRFLNN